MILRSIYSIALVCFAFNFANSQCTFNNTFQGNLDPTGIGAANSASTTTATAGDYYQVNVCAGAEYTFTTCGSSGFDTFLTLMASDGTTVLDSNDDDCGLRSTITWTATYSGFVNILLDELGCGHNTTSQSLEVIQNIACPSLGSPSDCASTIALSCGGALTDQTTFGAGNDVTNSSCHIATGGEDVCYAITVPANVNGILVTFDNVVDNNDTWLEAIFTGNTCSNTNCSQSDQFDIALGAFGSLSNTTGFSFAPSAGSQTVYLWVDAQNDAIYNFDISVECVTSAFAFDTDGCGSDTDNDAIEATVNGSSTLEITPCQNHTFCHTMYVENPGWEWIRDIEINLGAGYTNVTNLTANVVADGSFELHNYVGGGTINCVNGVAWNGTYFAGTNTIDWEFNSGTDLGCGAGTWGDGSGNNQNCAELEFCFDADIAPNITLADLNVGFIAEDDGQGLGGATAVGNDQTSLDGTVFTILNDGGTPNFTSCPGTQNEVVDGNCDFVIPDYTSLAVATDNCGSPIITQLPAPGTLASVGTTQITLTATDGSSNTDVCTFDMIVSDNINPTAVCQNITLNLDASGNASTTAAAIDNGSSDNCGVQSILFSGTASNSMSFDCNDLATSPNQVTIVVTDVNGNFSSCNADVTIIDNIDPTAVCDNINVNLDASGSVNVSPADINDNSSDNCSITSMTIDGVASVTYNCTHTSASQNATLEVFDASGNSNTCVANITIIDGINPTAVCNSSVNLNLDAAGSATLTTAMVNNGSSDNCSINSLSLSQTNFTCADLTTPSLDADLTVTDPSGNSHTCTVDINLIDNIAPTITCPGNQTAGVDNNCAYVLTDLTSLATANDNCTGVTVTQLPLAGTNLPIGTHTITLTATDGSGGTNQCTFDLEVEDQTPPTAICQNFNAILDASGNITVNPSDIDNGSSDNCGISAMTINGNANESFDCSDLGIVNNVLLTVFDAAGNSSFCAVDVTVIDNISPTFTTCIGNQTSSVDANCQFTLLDYTSMVTATDNCSVTLTQSPTAGNVVAGTTTVTITAEDPAGNTATCIFDVVVSDNTAPNAVCQNITIQLDASGNASITGNDIDGGSTDNCNITTYTPSQTAFTCANIGTNNVDLTVEDGNGNSDVCTAVVTVEDNIDPVASCQNITVQLDASGNVTVNAADIDGGSSDNCGIDNMTINGGANVSYDCSHTSATQTAVLEVFDASGNSHTCIANITVEDNVAPTAICQNISVDLDATGNVAITTAQIDNGSNDACGIASLSLDITSFSCTELGANTVTLTVEDNNGNQSTCTSTVTVNDPNTPTADAGSNDVICADGTYTLSGSVGGSATTLTWSSSGDGSWDDNTLAGATYTPGPNDIAAGTVDLTITSNLAPCADASATMTLTINPLPTFTVVSPGTNPSACGAADGSIDISGLTSGSTYDLSYFDGSSTQTITGITGVTSYTIAGLVAGGYSTFTITDQATGCSSTDATSVALSDPSAPSFTVVSPGNDPTTCGGSDGSITLISLNPASTYDISFEDGSATVTNFTGVSPDGFGNYTFNGLTADSYTNFTVVEAGCTSSDGIMVTLSDPAAPTFTVGNETDPTSCGGNEGTITISGLTDGLTYDITYNDGSTQTLTGVNSTSGDYIITGLTAGTFTNFTVTDQATGCTGNDNSSFTLVDPNGPVFTVGNESDPTTCGGTEGTITLSGLNDALTYNITYDDGAAQSITAINSISGDYIMTGLTAGTYNNFTVVDAATGCSGSVTTSITLVDPNAPTFLAGNGLDPTTCGGADGSITITGLTDGLSYDITYDNGTVQTLNGVGSTGGSYVITGLAAGSYTNFTVTLTGCTGNDTQTITLTDPAAPSAPVAGFDATYCEGDAIVDLNAAGTGGTLNWYDGVGANIGTGGVLTPAGTVGTSQYFVDETINGCTGAQTLITITINALPTPPTAGTDAVYCDGDAMIDLTATANLGGTLDWSDGTSSIGSGTALTPSSSIGTAIYYVTETANGCLGAADSVIVTVNPIPVAPVASGNVIYCLGNTIADISATPSEGGILNWFDDVALTNQVDTGMTYSPNASAIGVYTYYVTEDAQGCLSTSTEVTIEIEQCIVLEVEIPTGFTPDGDGTNDTWEIPNLGTLYPDAVVKVFNRWGSLIFESDPGYTTPWDGTFKGEMLPSESFYFIIDYKDTVDSREPATGPLTIIRK